MPTGFSEALQQEIRCKAGYDCVAPNHSYHTASADFDGDGNDDLIIYSQDSIMLFAKGLGNGSFESPFRTIIEGTELTSHGKLPCRSSIAVGDFNGDGKPDISITGFVGNCPSVDSLHLSSKTFTFLNTMEWPAAPLTTETATTETGTTSTSNSITTSSSTSMFELAQDTPTSDSIIGSSTRGSTEDSDILARLGILEVQVMALQEDEKPNTLEIINLSITALTLVLGGIALVLERDLLSQTFGLLLERNSRSQTSGDALPQSNDLTSVVVDQNSLESSISGESSDLSHESIVVDRNSLESPISGKSSVSSYEGF